MDERYEENRPGSGDGGERFRQAGAEARSKGQEIAGQMTAEAKERARQMAERKRHGVADTLGRVGDALQMVARDLQDRQPTTSRILGEAASGMENMAEQIAERPIDEVLQRVQETARRQPLLVVAGAAVAGMALTRLMKASYRHEQPERGFSAEESRSEELPATGAERVGTPAVGPLPTYTEPVQPVRPGSRPEEEPHGTE